MTLSRRTRIVCAVGGAAALIAVGGGVTAAVTDTTPTNDYAIACSSTHHALRLINSNGSCPSGYSRIDLAAAPTPLVISSSAAGHTVRSSVTIRGVTVGVSCTPSDAAALTVTAASAYTVGGEEYSSLGGASQVNDGADGMQSQVQDTFGIVTADVLVEDAGQTLSIQLHEQETDDSCFVHAQVEPSD